MNTVVALLVAVAGWAVGFLWLDTLLVAPGVALLAFLAGRWQRTEHHGVVTLVLGTAATAATGLLLTGADAAIAAAAGVGALAVVPWVVGRWRRRHAELARAGWDHAEQLEQAADAARARERSRLAAEMHDLVGHELAQAALRVGALEVTATLDPEHRASARAARKSVTAAAERLADAMRLLRADETEPAGRVEDVIDRARAGGLVVELTSDGTPTDPVIARTVHRVVAEAVTNAIKHAPGAPVTVHLTASDLRIINGPARRPARPTGSGHGLVGLAERVTMVGGRFAAGPTPDGGFEVTAHLPDRPRPPTTTSSTRAHAERTVRRSARRAVLVAVGVAAGTLLAVLGYVFYDAASSVLPAADFDRLRVGRPVDGTLPERTRVDAPDGMPPAPEGSTCRYYSVVANPFTERGDDLYRLCFAGDRLVAKDLVIR
jgi:signal transduction histidine kinase